MRGEERERDTCCLSHDREEEEEEEEEGIEVLSFRRGLQ